MCNRYIKFDYFFNFARDILFADIIATGHYAKITFIKNKYYLQEALDKEKDQTYFLCQILKETLPFLYFPISDMKKTEVRDLARKIFLPNSEAKESMGICFIGKNNFNKFISNYLKEEEGNIVELPSGKILGLHKNVNYFTLGQRKGLKVSSDTIPYYVIGKNIDKREVYISKG
jgi:tRNA-specific 2-thiouridylase